MPKRQKRTAAVAAASGGTQRRSPQLSGIEEALDPDPNYDALDEAFGGDPWPLNAEGRGWGGAMRLEDGMPAEELIVGADPEIPRVAIPRAVAYHFAVGAAGSRGRDRQLR